MAQTWVPGLIGGYLKKPTPDRNGAMPLYAVKEVIQRTDKRISGRYKLSSGVWIRWKIAKGGVVQCYGADPRLYVIVQQRIAQIVGHYADE
jgi:hypothetical protein